MPLDDVFDREEGLLRCRCFGLLALEEVYAYFTRWAERGPLPPGSVEIADFSAVEDLAFDQGDTRGVLEAYGTFRSRTGIAGTVLYSTTDLGFGLARMLMTRFQFTALTGGPQVARDPASLTAAIHVIRSGMAEETP